MCRKTSLSVMAANTYRKNLPESQPSPSVMLTVIPAHIPPRQRSLSMAWSARSPETSAWTDVYKRQVWQKRAAEELKIPLFTSPLLLVPMISKTIGTHRKVGIITAAGKRFHEPRFLEASGINDEIPFVVGELDTCSEFMDCIRNQAKSQMDTALFERQVVNLAKDMIFKAPDIGAILLAVSYTHLP